jgi:hypothetical protein
MTVVDDAEHDADTADVQGGARTSTKSIPRQTSRDVGGDDSEDFVMIDAGRERDFAERASKYQQQVNGVHSPPSRDGLKSLAPPPDLAPTKSTLNLKPPPRPPPITTDGSKVLEPGREQYREGSPATSPALVKLLINREDGDPINTLPALQRSPPRSSSNGSPEPKLTLPSLTTALSDAGTPLSAPSPSLTRASPGQMSHFGPSPSFSQPSPHSGMSPPSLPLHSSIWRPNTREGSISTPSDYAIVSASGSISTPASSIIIQSPGAALHLTPTTLFPDQTRPEALGEQVMSPEGDDEELDGIEGPFSSSNYKCSIPGCTAAPFQTQYLLNSHMNVHSDTRPHFCPVKGCARGPGGQGFKRKNEMIRLIILHTYHLTHTDYCRHGLVHTSPGYMCPFCPDQQHKYPRPDNLQRHVRVHHVDKDRDDPALREVLAQRAEGGSRGRRRRLGSA